MADIATAYANAQQQQAEQLARRATERARSGPAAMGSSDMDPRSIGEQKQVHCFDPWIIAKSEPNRERQARISLLREGFECWYPAGRLVKTLPRRLLSSKTRHKLAHVILEDVRMPFPGYLFIRRIGSSMPVERLFELTGVLGVCMFGEFVARIHDYQVELMRVKEDAGEYDRWEMKVGMSEKQYYLAEVRQSEAARERWTSPPRTIGRLDESNGRRIHLVEEFGRITRVIAATGDQHIPALHPLRAP